MRVIIFTPGFFLLILMYNTGICFFSSTLLGNSFNMTNSYGQALANALIFFISTLE